MSVRSADVHRGMIRVVRTAGVMFVPRRLQQPLLHPHPFWRPPCGKTTDEAV